MGGYSTDLKFDDWARSRDGGVTDEFRNPFRPAVAANHTPSGYEVMPSQCGLFRLPSGDYSNSDLPSKSEADFWVAFRKLQQQVSPVTAESIRSARENASHPRKVS